MLNYVNVDDKIANETSKSVLNQVIRKKKHRYEMVNEKIKKIMSNIYISDQLWTIHKCESVLFYLDWERKICASNNIEAENDYQTFIQQTDL